MYYITTKRNDIFKLAHKGKALTFRFFTDGKARHLQQLTNGSWQTKGLLAEGLQPVNSGEAACSIVQKLINNCFLANKNGLSVEVVSYGCKVCNGTLEDQNEIELGGHRTCVYKSKSIVDHNTPTQRISIHSNGEFVIERNDGKQYHLRVRTSKSNGRILEKKSGSTWKKIAKVDGATITPTTTGHKQELDLLEGHLRNTEKIKTYVLKARCRKCNRDLTDPLSIREGLGPHCRAL